MVEQVRAQSWEYYIAYIYSVGAVAAELDDIGKGGWELVTATPSGVGNLLCIFKRPVQ